MTKIFIVILNFNGGEEVLACLGSLIKEGKRTNWREYRILLVDNGSQDGSIEQIKNLKLKMKSDNIKIKIIENEKNLGFAAGCNVGIRYALEHGAQAVMLLNQDTVAVRGFLRPLLENPAEIVSPVIKFKRGQDWVYDYGGRINWWLGRTEHFETKNQEPKTESQIDYVSGCAMFIKKPVFDKIGLLDERYFLYFEDVDFCLRAKATGFSVAVEPRSVVVHKLFEKEQKPLKQHLMVLKSNFLFANNYLPLCRRPVAFVYLLVILVKIVLGGFR